MEVILLDNVGSLGVLGDRVDVKPGYGRNFLIPQGKAVPATQENIEKFEARRAELEAAAAAEREAAERREAIAEEVVMMKAALRRGAPHGRRSAPRRRAKIWSASRSAARRSARSRQSSCGRSRQAMSALCWIGAAEFCFVYCLSHD